MPFRSESQRRFMYAKHPEIAKRWSKEYPNQGDLPEHVKQKALKEATNKRPGLDFGGRS